MSKKKETFEKQVEEALGKASESHEAAVSTLGEGQAKLASKVFEGTKTPISQAVNDLLGTKAVLDVVKESAGKLSGDEAGKVKEIIEALEKRVATLEKDPDVKKAISEAVKKIENPSIARANASRALGEVVEKAVKPLPPIASAGNKLTENTLNYLLKGATNATAGGLYKSLGYGSADELAKAVSERHSQIKGDPFKHLGEFAKHVEKAALGEEGVNRGFLRKAFDNVKATYHGHDPLKGASEFGESVIGKTKGKFRAVGGTALGVAAIGDGARRIIVGIRGKENPDTGEREASLGQVVGGAAEAAALGFAGLKLAARAF